MKFATVLMMLALSANAFAARSQCTNRLAAIQNEITQLSDQSERVETSFEAGRFLESDAAELLITLVKKRIALRQESEALQASRLCK